MEVLVVGAGPVGLTMAMELARRGVSFRVIDKCPAPSTLSKALAIHARTMEIFDQMEVIEPFLQQGFRVEGMSAHMGDAARSVEVRFGELDSPYPYILDIPQSHTEAILIEHLAGLGIQVERGVELVGLRQTVESVEVRLRNPGGAEETCRVQWVIGCDGAHSTVRHQLGLAFEGTPYPDTFVLGDVRLEWALPEDRIQVFIHEEGLLAAFPYGNRRYRVMANNTQDAASADREPDLETLNRFVQSRSPVEARISEPTWLNWFHSHLRHASETRVHRVFLVGDAAHIHSPAGGQGMNTGIQDAYNLAWKLALVTSGKAGDALLDSYPEERLAVAESVLKLSDGLLRGATSNRRVVKFLREHLAPILLNTDLVQHRMTREISEVAIHYRSSPIVRAHWRNRPLPASHPVHPGDRAPDVRYADGPGTSRRFHDLLRETGHALFAFAGQEAQLRELAERLEEWGCRDAFALHDVGAGDSDCRVPGYRSVPDRDKAVAVRYGLKPGSLLVIRPDGYVGYIGDSLDPQPLRDYVSRVFQR